MPEDMGERTEMPTPRRLEEARESGRVARSPDLTAAVDMIGAVVVLVLLGGQITSLGRTLLVKTLQDPTSLLDAGSVRADGFEAMLRGGLALAPLLGLMVLIVAATQFAQVGFLLSTQAIQPRFDRLNIFAGFGRLFGRRNLIRTGLNLVKLGAILGVAYVYLAGHVERLAVLPAMTLVAGFLQVGRLALELAAALLLLMLAVGLADWWYQRWQHLQDLKMTKDQVKDERRSMEGDPKVKRKRFEMMRTLAYQRINAAVPKADVIVTNPTHFSVAIKYDPDTMHAPRVVAKGVDEMAFRIRQVAIAHEIPLVERPPLARGLYYSVDVGGTIPVEYYQAVAEVLAYVYNLDRQAAA